MQDRVRQKFQDLINSGSFEEIVSIDAGGSLDEVEAVVVDTVMSKISQVDSSQELLRVLKA
jgi:hypothetical protein